MLDMKQAWDRMIERYSPDRATAQRILRNPLYQRITDSFVGSHEYAAIEALYELHDAGEYDCIVVDTPPSRSALDFLEAPTRLTDFVGSRLLSLLSGSSSRFGFRAMNFAATPFLRLADRLLGAEVLKEVSEFVQQLQLLYGGVQERARSVSKLLRSPKTGFVVVTTLEHGPFGEAEFFCTKLREYKMAAARDRGQPRAPGHVPRRRRGGRRDDACRGRQGCVVAEHGAAHADCGGHRALHR